MDYSLTKEKLLILIFGVLVSVSIGVFTSLSPALFLATLFGLTFIYILLFKWNIAIQFLLISTLLNGILFNIGSTTLRPEQPIILACLISTLLTLLLRKNSRISFNVQMVLILLFIVYSYIVSYVVSPIFKVSHDGIVQLSISVLSFFIICQIYTINKQNIYKFITALFVVFGTLQAIYGIFAYLLYTMFSVDIGGLMFGQWETSVSVKGTFFEANLFGSYVSMCALFVLSIIMSKTNKKNKNLLYLCLFILIAALLLSWTRSAWIGFMIGFLFLLIVYSRKAFTFKNILTTILVFCFVLAPLFFVVQKSFDSAYGYEGAFISKIASIGDTDTGTAKWRFNEYNLALNHMDDNILFGKGYFSIKEYGEDTWISNTSILIFHDTGLIGLIIFTSIILSILIPSVRISLKRNFNQNTIYIVGITSAIIQLLFTYNFTPAHTLSLLWICLGLLLCLIRIHQDNQTTHLS